MTVGTGAQGKKRRSTAARESRSFAGGRRTGGEMARVNVRTLVEEGEEGVGRLFETAKRVKVIPVEGNGAVDSYVRTNASRQKDAKVATDIVRLANCGGMGFISVLPRPRPPSLQLFSAGPPSDAVGAYGNF
ncbi:hypothetical protein CRG98_047437 [Punica granatum]|uniref:Uncharacterized protein n=1 Tax=Punica granatum TaxID=22663 RepID=A0A2I0HKC5_PUNGR|nr:hypothetical protein CRG98_047437 [Punica granatum]